MPTNDSRALEIGLRDERAAVQCRGRQQRQSKWHGALKIPAVHQDHQGSDDHGQRDGNQQLKGDECAEVAVSLPMEGET